jgi:murein DD-endopeptidase MepM/ murein hydrolase activator NlpD
MRITNLVYCLFPLILQCACKAQPNPDSLNHNVDTIKKAAIIRHETIFDKKDTNSAIGKCYLKIGENIANFVEVTPKDTVTEWLLPFDLKNRIDTSQVQIRSPFGAGRTSHFRGHKHSGVDFMLYKKDTGIYVCPAATGIVCFKKVNDPFSSLTIKHILPDGSFIFTSYIHLKEIYVSLGDTVKINTRIGKLFSYREARRYRGPYNHLHFEVRKNFDDFGFGSSHCMNKQELAMFFYEPVSFLGEKLRVELAKASANKKDKAILGAVKSK